MSYMNMMTRRNEILKRNIGSYILKDNKQGLTNQENYFFQNMLRELYQNESEINAGRNQS